MKRLVPRYLKETSLTPKGANPLADVLTMKEPKDSPVDRLLAGMRRAFKALHPDEHPEITAALAEVETALKSPAPETDATVSPALTTALRDLAATVKGSKGCAQCKPGKPCDLHAGEYDKAQKAIQKEMEAISTSEAFAQNEMWRQIDALTSSIYSIMHDDGIAQKAGALKQTFAQFLDLVAASAGEPITKETPSMPEITDAQKAMADHTTKLAEMSAQLLVAQKEAADAKAAAEAATQQLLAQKEAAELKDLTVTAKELRGHIAGDDAALAKVLKQLDQPGRETVTAILKSANALIETSGAFKELGSSRPAPDRPSAVDQLDAKAKERAERASISYLEAYDLVAKENPALMNQVRREEISAA